MGTRAVVEGFWAAMRMNDWGDAAEHFVEDIAVVWPCSGEQIVGRENFVEVQAKHPSTTGHWSFDVHRIVVDGDEAVSEVTVKEMPEEMLGARGSMTPLDTEHTP
jgi:limonene-1,2-epoxide hydrolase